MVNKSVGSKQEEEAVEEVTNLFEGNIYGRSREFKYEKSKEQAKGVHCPAQSPIVNIFFLAFCKEVEVKKRNCKDNEDHNDQGGRITEKTQSRSPRSSIRPRLCFG